MVLAVTSHYSICLFYLLDASGVKGSNTPFSLHLFHPRFGALIGSWVGEVSGRVGDLIGDIGGSIWACCWSREVSGRVGDLTGDISGSLDSCSSSVYKSLTGVEIHGPPCLLSPPHLLAVSPHWTPLVEHNCPHLCYDARTVLQWPPSFSESSCLQKVSTKCSYGMLQAHTLHHRKIYNYVYKVLSITFEMLRNRLPWVLKGTSSGYLAPPSSLVEGPSPNQPA